MQYTTLDIVSCGNKFILLGFVRSIMDVKVQAIDFAILSMKIELAIDFHKSRQAF